MNGSGHLVHGGGDLSYLVGLLAHSTAGLHADRGGFLCCGRQLAAGTGDLTDGLLEAFGHAVKGLADAAKLVLAAIIGAGGEIPLCELIAGVFEARNGCTDAGNNAPRQQREHSDRQQGSDGCKYQIVSIRGCQVSFPVIRYPLSGRGDGVDMLIYRMVMARTKRL